MATLAAPVEILFNRYSARRHLLEYELEYDLVNCLVETVEVHKSVNQTTWKRDQ